VLAKYEPETVRFFLLRTHYRTALNYSDAHLDDARSGLKRLYTALDLMPEHAASGAVDWSNDYAKRFRAAMDEDFGTPEAIAVLFDLASEINRSKSAPLAILLKGLGDCLGLLQQEPKAYLQAGAGLSEERIQALIGERAAAKAAKDFARADAVRKELLGQGIVLKDSPTGTSWEVAQ
jgi:cysteinyl-tRNA synthetase